MNNAERSEGEQERRSGGSGIASVARTRHGKKEADWEAEIAREMLVAMGLISAAADVREMDEDTVRQVCENVGHSRRMRYEACSITRMGPYSFGRW